MWKTKVDNKIAVISLCSMLLISGIFMYGAQHLYVATLKEEARVSDTSYIPTQRSRTDYFESLALNAKAIYVYEANTGKVLYEKNADMPLPLASLTKVMTGIIAKESSGENQTVSIDQEALSTEGESGLLEGERWNLKNLLSFMLVSSSNDGAAAIARALDTPSSFVSQMNTKAETLKLETLEFVNPTGLDEISGETGGYGSAKEMAKLFEYALRNHPELLEPTKYSGKEYQSDTQTLEARNTNASVSNIPNLIASKTGYTLQAGGNLGIVFDKGLNEPVIIVVLGSTYDGRFTDVANLASSTLRTYNESR